MKWSGQLLTWACTLVVARLLTPSDFGLVGMAAVYLGLVTAFSEFGLGTAVITLRDLKHEQVAQINTVSLLFGALGFAISCGVAIPLGGFFRAPQLPSVVVVMSAAFVITAFRTVPYSLLQKDMRFKLPIPISLTGSAGICAAGGPRIESCTLYEWKLGGSSPRGPCHAFAGRHTHSEAGT